MPSRPERPEFLRAVELVRRFAAQDEPPEPIQNELDRLCEKMTRLEYDRLHLYYLRLKEGE